MYGDSIYNHISNGGFNANTAVFRGSYDINNGVNGFLYKKGNSHDLSEKIKMIAENKSLYEKMSNNAEKRFFEELNIENTVRKTEELYNCLYNLCKK